MHAKFGGRALLVELIFEKTSFSPCFEFWRLSFGVRGGGINQAEGGSARLVPECLKPRYYIELELEDSIGKKKKKS